MYTHITREDTASAIGCRLPLWVSCWVCRGFGSSEQRESPARGWAGPRGRSAGCGRRGSAEARTALLQTALLQKHAQRGCVGSLAEGMIRQHVVLFAHYSPPYHQPKLLGPLGQMLWLAVSNSGKDLVTSSEAHRKSATLCLCRPGFDFVHEESVASQLTAILVFRQPGIFFCSGQIFSLRYTHPPLSDPGPAVHLAPQHHCTAIGPSQRSSKLGRWSCCLRRCCRRRRPCRADSPEK